MIDFLKDNNEEVWNSYDRGGLNSKMTSYDIQKDLAKVLCKRITKAIMEEIGNRLFSVLIDESRNILSDTIKRGTLSKNRKDCLDLANIRAKGQPRGLG